MLIIDVSGPHNAPGEHFSYDLVYKPQPGEAGQDAELLEPVAVRVGVTYLEGVFVVDTRVRMRFRLRCARCLESFEYKTEVEFSDQYDTEVDPEKQPDEQSVVTNDRIDLTAEVRDTVIGALPMKLLCREDCPGLCSVCGASLAEGPCGCPDREKMDPRMEKLAQLLEGHQEKGVEK